MIYCSAAVAAAAAECPKRRVGEMMQRVCRHGVIVIGVGGTKREVWEERGGGGGGGGRAFSISHLVARVKGFAGAAESRDLELKVAAYENNT